MSHTRLALTQGDPSGVGPEIVLKALTHPEAGITWDPVVVAEWSALEALRGVIPDAPWQRLRRLEGGPGTAALKEALARGEFPVLDPVASSRRIAFGESTEADARGALAALDLGMDLASSGVCAALVTAPLSKSSIARHIRPDFRGHTEYLAARFGLHQYGREYLMTFLGSDLQVALLSTHLPLKDALGQISTQSILEALRCLSQHAGGRIAVAGVNPHAGEAGLLGEEDEAVVRPAVLRAREDGIDAHGPESPDSVFVRARRGEFDWVLALYHDQGLIAVKTAAFGTTTNWTMGLPFLRTSVDHGTAFGIAGRGVAEVAPLLSVVDTTLGLIEGRLPRGRDRARSV